MDITTQRLMMGSSSGLKGYIAVAHVNSPYISVYPWSSSTGFGTKYSDPSTLPTGRVNGVAFFFLD